MHGLRRTILSVIVTLSIGVCLVIRLQLGSLNMLHQNTRYQRTTRPYNRSSFTQLDEQETRKCERHNEKLRFKSAFTWTCRYNKCVKVLATKRHQGNTEYNTCKLTCNKYGMLFPRPRGVVYIGSETADFLPHSLTFDTNSCRNCSTQVRNMLFRAFNKFTDNAKLTLSKHRRKDGETTNDADCLDFGAKINVYININDNASTLMLQTDESYSLMVQRSLSNSTGKVRGGFATTERSRLDVTINAQTFFGARHSLETLSQLMAYRESLDCLQIVENVAIIGDSPAYPYRGLMIDTSRFFFSVEYLMKTIDALAQNKMNSLHWHITDTASFPLEIKSVPQFTQYGAYNDRKVYTHEQVRRVVTYGRENGVRVLPEFDQPAHTGAGWEWGPAHGMGKLAVCVNKQPWGSYCVEPPCGQLNPTNHKLYPILGQIYKEINEMFEPDLFHVGGDEVSLGCWKSEPSIRKYMHQNFGGNDDEHYLLLWKFFIRETEKQFRKKSKTQSMKYVSWNNKLTKTKDINKFMDPSKYIIQLWGKSTDIEGAVNVVNQGYQTIVSFNDYLYLDCGYGNWVGAQGNNWCTPYKDWKLFYELDPIQKLESGWYYNNPMQSLSAGMGYNRMRYRNDQHSVYNANNEEEEESEDLQINENEHIQTSARPRRPLQTKRPSRNQRTTVPRSSENNENENSQTSEINANENSQSSKSNANRNRQTTENGASRNSPASEINANRKIPATVGIRNTQLKTTTSNKDSQSRRNEINQSSQIDRTGNSNMRHSGEIITSFNRYSAVESQVDPTPNQIVEKFKQIERENSKTEKSDGNVSPASLENPGSVSLSSRKSKNAIQDSRNKPKQKSRVPATAKPVSKETNLENTKAQKDSEKKSTDYSRLVTNSGIVEKPKTIYNRNKPKNVEKDVKSTVPNKNELKKEYKLLATTEKVVFDKNQLPKDSQNLANKVVQKPKLLVGESSAESQDIVTSEKNLPGKRNTGVFRRRKKRDLSEPEIESDGELLSENEGEQISNSPHIGETQITDNVDAPNETSISALLKNWLSNQHTGTERPNSPTADKRTHKKYRRLDDADDGDNVVMTTPSLQRHVGDNRDSEDNSYRDNRDAGDNSFAENRRKKRTKSEASVKVDNPKSSIDKDDEAENIAYSDFENVHEDNKEENNGEENNEDEVENYGAYMEHAQLKREKPPILVNREFSGHLEVLKFIKEQEKRFLSKRPYDDEENDEIREKIRKSVLGMESAMWSEQVDEITSDGKIWPRTAALAERLWSDPQTSANDAVARLVYHRNRMVDRGIMADALRTNWCEENEGNCF